MKRENLESKEFGLIIASRNFPFYAAPEADAVMDELEERIKELEAENERLKGELEMEHDDCSNAKKCEVEYHKAYEKELDENVILRNENAKLKCLVLHAMSYAVVSLTSNTNKFKPFRLFVKYNDAYRKAKAELKEKTK